MRWKINYMWVLLQTNGNKTQMLLVIYIPQIMTVFLVDPRHLHLIFVTFCLSILNNSLKKEKQNNYPNQSALLDQVPDESTSSVLNHQGLSCKSSCGNEQGEIAVFAGCTTLALPFFGLFNHLKWHAVWSPTLLQVGRVASCENGSSCDSHISDLNVFSFLIHLWHFLIHSLNWKIHQCVVLFPDIKYLLKIFLLSRCMAGSLNLRRGWIMLNWHANLKMEAKK